MFLVSSLMEDDIYLTSCYEIFRPYCIHWWPYTKLSPFLLNHVSMHYDVGTNIGFFNAISKTRVFIFNSGEENNAFQT